jgi:L-asparaginase / beta-aspartyl-peptidase
MTRAIVVHGGAWAIPDLLVGAHERGCADAAALGYRLLGKGATALDAVVAAVSALEDDPTYDAGFGAFLNRDGVVELDAGVMDGASLVSGAVASVTGVRNPASLARRVLEIGVDRLVVGPGAEALADELGVERVAPEALATEDARAFWRRHGDRDPRKIFEPHPSGTVGAVAVDARGQIAAATSTGGLPGKRRGRVGDSPIVGCGFFADSLAAGASSTGYGEAILTVGLARRVVDLVAAGATPDEAARAGIEALAAPRVGGVGGVIVLDATGRVGAVFNTTRMARAWIDGYGRSYSGVEP